MAPVADLAFRDRALLVGDVLVLADLHLGRGKSGGIELPVGDGADVLDRFRSLLEDHAPAEVVVAGDLLHSFRTVPRTVEDTLAGIETAANAAGADLLVTPGNHDTMLETVFDGPTPDHYRVGDTVVCHGHELPAVPDADRYVVGHDHPTIEIEGRRRPCYLVGHGTGAGDGDADGPGESREDPPSEEPGRRAGTGPGTGDRSPPRPGSRPGEGPMLVVLPAFNRLLRGVAVNDLVAADFQSPLCRSVDALAPIVRDEQAGETLTFPPLGEIRHHL